MNTFDFSPVSLYTHKLKIFWIECHFTLNY